jgi:membrane fusion protein, multidrug efflux system
MNRARNRIFPILLGIVVLLAIGGGLWWWVEGRHWQATDNAYVEADMAVIAAKVTGYVASVAVTDNQPVKAGDPLVTIVDADYRAALAKAEAEVERLSSEQGRQARAPLRNRASWWRPRPPCAQPKPRRGGRRPMLRGRKAC